METFAALLVTICTVLVAICTIATASYAAKQTSIMREIAEEHRVICGFRRRRAQKEEALRRAARQVGVLYRIHGTRKQRDSE